MNVPLRTPASAPRRSWPVLLVQLAIVLVVAAVAAATFVLSYAGVHAIALQSSVPPELARLYPAVFDAVLVIACLAVPALREARWWTRWYTWLVILVIVAVLGAMDAVHAMNVALPRRDTAGVIAVLPWVLLLLAFSLWLAVLRHFRAQQSRPATWNAGEVAEAGGAAEPAAPIAPLALPAPAVAATLSETAAAAPAAPPAAAAPAAEVGEPAAAPDVPAPAAASEPTAALDVPAPAAPSERTGPAKAAAPDEQAAASEPGWHLAGQLTEVPQPDGASQAPGERLQPDGPDFAEESPLEALLNGRPADAEERSDDDSSVPGITYSRGPRLRRVRSLPSPPMADE